MPRFSPTYPTAHHCLGLPVGATAAEIRTTYKTLAIQLHPDKAEEADREQATAQFQELQAAYVACLTAVSNEPTDEKADETSEYYWTDAHLAGDELQVAKESTDEYLHWLRWLSDHEEDFFYMDEFGDMDRRPQYLNGVRLDRNTRLDDSNNKRNSSGNQRVTATQKLEMWKRQVAARLKRDEEFAAADSVPSPMASVTKHKKMRLRQMKQVLEAEAELEGKQASKAEEERVQQKLIAVAVKERQMMASGKMKMLEPVPDNWDDDVE